MLLTHHSFIHPHSAKTHSKPAVLAYLLDQCRVPADLPDDHLCTPLYYACNNDSVECCRLLLRARADPCAADRDGVTPLVAAARHGHVECMKRLLAHVTQGPHAQARQHALLEAKPMPTQLCSRTPLLVALGQKKWAAAELHLNAGANPTAVEANQHSAPAELLASLSNQWLLQEKIKRAAAEPKRGWLLLKVRHLVDALRAMKRELVWELIGYMLPEWALKEAASWKPNGAQ